MLPDPDKDNGHGIGRGGGGGHGRGPEALRRPTGRPGPGGRRVEGARGDHENTLPLGGRVLGQVRLCGERGRGWVGDRQRQAPQSLTRFH